MSVADVLVCCLLFLIVWCLATCLFCILLIILSGYLFLCADMCSYNVTCLLHVSFIWLSIWMFCCLLVRLLFYSSLLACFVTLFEFSDLFVSMYMCVCLSVWSVYLNHMFFKYYDTIANC